MQFSFAVLESSVYVTQKNCVQNKKKYALAKAAFSEIIIFQNFSLPL